MNETQTVYVTVKVKIKNDVDSPPSVIENCDYEFSHPDIVDTEIIAIDENY